MSANDSNVVPNAGNANAAWEYEAPQYCDFESMNTFEADPESDKFFSKCLCLCFHLICY